jgi:halimadienyl-diphosphate synthase
LLSVVGSGCIEPTAYDTAWVARVPQREFPDRPAFPQALEWLVAHQHADGSWGTPLNYHHDRIISTLNAMLTLAHWKDRFDRSAWQDRIEAAQGAVWRDAAGMPSDPYDTIGFELILPTLLDEARRCGLDVPYDAFATARGVARMREAKLKRIPPELVYTRHISTIFSAEFLGDELDVERVSGLQDENGSIASSPSATAYVLLKDPHNLAARDYLAGVLARHGGAAPAVDPIDVFEPAWTLYNVSRVWPDASQVAPAIEPHVAALAGEWQRKNGAGYNSYFAVPDLDGTSMVFRLLTWAGIPPDPALFAQFEEDDHFRCFPYERNPSISAHVHLLDALRAAPPFPDRERMLRKVLSFLDRSRTLRTFWFDKWHASPYYTTAHAITALREDAGPSTLPSVAGQALAADAVYWIVNTQNEDGSWGYYSTSTAEETAYCVQALVAYSRDRAVNQGLGDAIRRGVDYLVSSAERIDCRYTPLWLAKSLYSPKWVVHSTVLSALALAESF